MNTGKEPKAGNIKGIEKLLISQVPKLGPELEGALRAEVIVAESSVCG